MLANIKNSPVRDLLRLLAEHQGQAALEYVNLLAPAIGIRLRRINLARLQAPFPLFDFTGGAWLWTATPLCCREWCRPRPLR